MGSDRRASVPLPLLPHQTDPSLFSRGHPQPINSSNTEKPPGAHGRSAPSSPPGGKSCTHLGLRVMAAKPGNSSLPTAARRAAGAAVRSALSPSGTEETQRCQSSIPPLSKIKPASLRQPGGAVSFRAPTVCPAGSMPGHRAGAGFALASAWGNKHGMHAPRSTWHRSDLAFPCREVLPHTLL